MISDTLLGPITCLPLLDLLLRNGIKRHIQCSGTLVESTSRPIIQHTILDLSLGMLTEVHQSIHAFVALLQRFVLTVNQFLALTRKTRAEHLIMYQGFLFRKISQYRRRFLPVTNILKESIKKGAQIVMYLADLILLPPKKLKVGQ